MNRKHTHQTDPVAARQLGQLLDLAQDVSRYLRHHASPAVRLATALLLAASLAACNASASDPTMVQSGAVAPLTQEVVSGLPRGPGTYPVMRGSVFRDQRGIYQFEWLDQGATGGPGHIAYASRLRLIRDDELRLEMPESGDPILHLPDDENVGLTQQAQVGAGQPGPAYYPPAYSYWHPFSPGMVVVGRPAYYDPPRTVVVDGTSGGSSGSTSGSALRGDGGTVSETARPPSARVTGVQSAVSGRAGGTGAGSAVTSRNVASGASSSSSSSSASASSAARSTSGSSGVSAPRSSGFSAGSGSSGGSAAS